MSQIQGQKPKLSTRVRIIAFILALLILIGGTIFWALSSLNSTPALFTAIFGALAAIFSFMQLIPIIFAKSSPEPASPVPSTPAQQPINIYNVIPSSQSPQPSPLPIIPTTPTTPPPASPVSPPAASDPLNLRALPLPSDPRN